jgi:hypothetical protein
VKSIFTLNNALNKKGGTAPFLIYMSGEMTLKKMIIGDHSALQFFKERLLDHFINIEKTGSDQYRSINSPKTKMSSKKKAPTIKPRALRQE